KAERETSDRLIAHFLSDKIGATFEGRIAGVTHAGLFIKLDGTGADGFVPARTIGREFLHYEEGLHALVGARSGISYRLGDRVTVTLVEVAPVAGALRFELISEGRGRAAGHDRDTPTRDRAFEAKSRHKDKSKSRNKSKDRRKAKSGLKSKNKGKGTSKGKFQ